ncbi:MAG: hypothetical protein M3436_00900 [Pseudomonadota bacterium]|nr:hypothetical protein [Pseudomonadota bacterium]
MIETFVEEVQQRLRKSVRDIESQLGRGQCGSWEQYHHKVGRIDGLQEASSIMSQALTVFHEEDEQEVP